MKKKGFTLVELLAVIVILAIIALIATPIILNVIETAKKGAIESSAIGYLDAVEKYIVEKEVKGTTTEAGIYSVADLEVKIKGTSPTSGSVQIDNKKEVTYAILCIEGKKVVYKDNKAQIESEECTNTVMYKEEILNGADPVIKGELIPVNISSDGKVTKANTEEQWYSYENKKWANAVILIEDKEYKEGEEIEESNIKQHYVWIPKYSYILWNVNSNNTNNVGSPISITFGSEAKTTGENNGDSYIHPAFTNFNTNGIWVGKFETSYNEETYTNKETFLTSNPNTSAATTGNNIIIKPNVRSLTNKKVSELYTLGRQVNSNLNSHMMTNSEWGAVAYLTYSKYGKCNETTCEEVYINNVNTGYYGSTALYSGQWEYGATITGCSGATSSAGANSNKDSCESGYAWNEINNKASTNGNITGIYDMSGGNWEYVMAVLEDASGNPYSGRNNLYNSGFNGLYGCPTCEGQTITSLTSGIPFPSDKRYYDIYKYNYGLGTDIWYDYSTGKLGDATKEIANTKSNASSGDRGLWYNDYAHFPSTASPWFARGGNFSDGSGAGVFYFYRFSGHANTHVSSRVVLAY